MEVGGAPHSTYARRSLDGTGAAGSARARSTHSRTVDSVKSRSRDPWPAVFVSSTTSRTARSKLKPSCSRRETPSGQTLSCSVLGPAESAAERVR